MLSGGVFKAFNVEAQTCSDAESMEACSNAGKEPAAKAQILMLASMAASEMTIPIPSLASPFHFLLAQVLKDLPRVDKHCELGFPSQVS